MSIENETPFSGDLVDKVVLPVGEEERIREEAERKGEDPDAAVRSAKKESQDIAKRNIEAGEDAVKEVEKHARKVFDETETEN